MDDEKISHAAATSQLEKLLSHDQIAGFSVGEIWTMRFVQSDMILAFHNFYCSKEAMIGQCLKEVDLSLFNSPDHEDIAKTTILSSLLRKEILAISVDKDAALTLTFEGPVSITVATDTDIVDWQWCLTRNYPNPYIEQSELACFWKGEVLS